VTPDPDVSGDLDTSDPDLNDDFNGKSNQHTGGLGSAVKNAPLTYNVSAVTIVDQTQITKQVTLTQDEIDTLRQEYVDYAVTWVPSRNIISFFGSRVALNLGPYSYIPQEVNGTMASIVSFVNTGVNVLLNQDIQVLTPDNPMNPSARRCNPDDPNSVPVKVCPANTIVVLPNVTIPGIGPLGFSDPQGDDVCSIPLVNGICKGAIMVGPKWRSRNPCEQPERSNFRGNKFRLQKSLI
jgi:hypothetical protein